MNFIFAIFTCCCICCTQKSYKNNPFLYHLSKEIPELTLLDGMEYIGNHNCEGSPANADSFNVYIGPLYISKHEITNEDFCYFLNEDSIGTNTLLIKELVAIGAEQNKIIIEYGKYKPLKGFENYPVVMVSWWGAKKYCEWLTAYVRRWNVKSDRYYIGDYRLPTELEWMYAFAVYKKQSDFIISACNETDNDLSDSLNRSAPLVRNVKKDSLTQTGVAGMNENVYEWTDDNYYPKQNVTDYSMNSDCEFVMKPHALVRKYGLTDLNLKNAGCGRIGRLRSGFYSDIGFRIVQTHLGRSSGFEF